MRVSFRSDQRPLDRLYEIVFRGDLTPPALSLPQSSVNLILVDAQADVDISDAAFDFVRSIRVFEITYQQRRSSDGDCNSWGTVYMGSYGEQVDYTRRQISVSAIPEASDFGIPANYGNYWHRSVFVDGGTSRAPTATRKCITDT